MSNRLDPLIQEKLRAFARRRRRLIILRGVLAAKNMLLLTMVIVAAVDYSLVLPDWARWTLSGTAYAAVLIIAWRQCLSWLLHAPDERQLARLVEHAEPHLREDLISAVELGRTKGEVFDSEQFRALLQKDVAHRMEEVEVKSLLPVALIRRYIGYALCIVAMIVAMGMATGWKAGALFLRALLPGANLDRISQTGVIIKTPAKGDDLVAYGDTVRIEIELTGERANKASIETFGEKEGRQVMEMQPTGKDQFAATVNVGRESVRYRIKAGDALTRKYVLDARERPFVTQFEKTYHFPSYSKLPDKSVAEADGNLIALEGTEVELKLTTNQRIRSGELALEQGKNSLTIPLTPGADGKLTARVPLNASGSYRVHLVSEDTGFGNKFSPENELRAEPDLVPSVELESPKSDLILSNNELVDLVGNASDDLGLAKVVQVLKVNDGPWRETILNEVPGQKTRVNYRWDLYELSLKPGDLVTTKLAATDLKGNRGESRPLQITITAAGFELRRLQALESLRALNETTYALMVNAENLAKTAQKSREQFNGSESEDVRRQAVVALAGAVTEFEAKYGETWTALSTALRESQAGHISAELVMLGRELSRLDVTNVRLAKLNLDLINAHLSMGGGRELMQEAVESCQQAFHRARISQSAMESVTSAEELAALAENAQVVSREQQRLMELAAASGNDPKKWQPLVTRLRIALTQIKALEDLVTPMAERGRSALRQRAQQTISSFSKRRLKLEQALTGGEPTAKLLLDPTMEMTRSLKDYTRQFADWHREFAQQPVKMMKEIQQDVGPTYAHVGRLSRDLQTVRGHKQVAPEIQVTLADSRWAARADSLRKHGDVEEIRPTADNLFVSDLRAATAAIEALHAVAAGTELVKLEEKFVELEGILRILESGHNLQETLDGLTFLATNERWDLRNLSSRTQAPRDWKWLEHRLRAIPDELGKALTDKFDPETRQAFEGAQQILWKAQHLPAWNGVEGEMNQRGNQDRLPVSAKADGEVLAGQVRLALELLRKPMDLARQQLAKISPTVSEIAAALAKEQEELKKETAEHAQEVEQQNPGEAKAENMQRLAEQQKINQKVETLKDLLRAEANQQNILEKDQREAMRDADDALALLKDPPPKAEQALQDAVADEQKMQKADLERATEQQQELTEALQQIAKHYEAVEQGKDLAETRAALREAEKELGIKEELDQQFAHAQMLAEMAQKDAAELLKELEAKLPNNPLMQKELSDITKDALANAEQKLQQASQQENAVAQKVNEQAQQEMGNSQQPEAQNAAQAAKQAVEAAKAAQKAAEIAEQQAEKAGNQKADQQADMAGDQAAEAVKQAEKAMQAAEEMAKAGDAQQAMQKAERVAQKAAQAAQAARQAAEAAKQAQATAQQAAQKGEKQGENQESAQQAGEAAQQAEKAAQAAEQAQALAQQAMQQAKAMAENKATPPESSNPAQQGAKTAVEAANQAAKAAQAAQKAAESAESQANTAENTAAAQKADMAGNEAAKAQEAAQAAAKAAGEMAQAANPQQAMKAAEMAAQKAGEAAQAAEQAANAAQQAQASAQEAAQTPGEHQGENQQSAQQSGEAAQQAKAAAQAAKQAQAAAQQAANQAKAMAQQNAQLANAAQQQQGIAQNANEAGADLERAGRHEMRLGNQLAGEQLKNLGSEVQETAQMEVPAAAKALNAAQMAAQAQSAVGKANTELGQELASLQQAQQGNPAAAQQAPAPNAQAQPAGQQAQAPAPAQGQPANEANAKAGAAPAQPSSPAEQQAMARALDALDQQLNAPPPAAAQQAEAGQPGEQPPQPGQPASQGQPGQPSPGAPQPSAAQAAMAQAAQSAQAAMRQNRMAQGKMPGQGESGQAPESQSQTAKSEGGAAAQADARDYKLDVNAQGLRRGEWGKLPKKMADQLTKGQQEAVAGDYRQAVEAYYKVIAEKAKQQK
jgi:hypothetical protein